MTLVTLVATAALVYVAIAAFAYHDAYELRERKRPAPGEPEVEDPHATSDPEFSRFLLRLAFAGALITFGAAMIAQTISADLSATGGALLFSHPMADWVAGIVLVAIGVFLLFSARTHARQ